MDLPGLISKIIEFARPCYYEDTYCYFATRLLEDTKQSCNSRFISKYPFDFFIMYCFISSLIPVARWSSAWVPSSLLRLSFIGNLYVVGIIGGRGRCNFEREAEEIRSFLAVVGFSDESREGGLDRLFAVEAWRIYCLGLFERRILYFKWLRSFDDSIVFSRGLSMDAWVVKCALDFVN